MELLLAGCSAVRLIKKSDPVTEMKMAGHYFSRGVSALRGIEF